MKKLARSICLIIMSMVICSSGCDDEPEVELIITDNISLLTDRTIESSVLNQTMKYNIVLPNDYYVNTDRYYPVLYLFHGMYGDNNDWANNGNAKETLKKAFVDKVVEPMIVVMPDAFNTFYVDGYENGLKYETFFWDEFLPFVEDTYRVNTSRETRFIAGLSMGGFGASYYAFTYPDKFIYCYSMSGAVGGVGTSSTPSISSIIGSYDSYDILPGYTIDIGSSDFLFASNQAEHEALDTLGFEHEYITRDGAHDWVFWQKSLEIALERIGQYLN